MPNYQLFLTELCDLLEVPRPDPTVPDDDDNAYVFERSVVFVNPDGTAIHGRIDLYKRGCFVLETKQGVEKQDDEAAALRRRQERNEEPQERPRHARHRGLERHDAPRPRPGRAIRPLSPGHEARPPFLVVVDVGHTIELYAEFTQTGGTYIPFPDASSTASARRSSPTPTSASAPRRLDRSALARPGPPQRQVTREIAASLAELARSLEAAKHDPQDVAQFLMRCLFTMFAEDVGLLPKKSASNNCSNPSTTRPTSSRWSKTFGGK